MALVMGLGGVVVAKIEMKGLDDYTRALSRLQLDVRDQVCGKAIYAGAAIVADTIKAAINALPEGLGRGTPERPLEGPTKAQKRGLVESFGISRMREDNGFLNVKAGFDGYNAVKTKRWPQGQPNAMVARSVERGTSFMRSNPFVKKAVSAARAPALEAMKKSVEESITDLMND